jgi:hypothetical protein
VINFLNQQKECSAEEIRGGGGVGVEEEDIVGRIIELLHPILPSRAALVSVGRWWVLDGTEQEFRAFDRRC